MARLVRGPSRALLVTQLTLRQFAAGKAVRVVAFFAFVPVIFAAIFALDSGGLSSREFLDGLIQHVIAPTILPLAILVLATNALGNEIEDRTMVYLVVKPLSRTRVILEKFAAIVLMTTPLLWAGTLVAFILTTRGSAGDHLDLLVAAWTAIVFAVLAYGSLFMALSLIIPRALLAGILYSLLWETTFGRFIPGIRLVSIRHYVQSIFVRLMDDPVIPLPQAMQLVPAMLTLLVLVAVALTIAVWRLRTMNLE